MNRRDLLNDLEFYDHLLFDQQVEPVALIQVDFLVDQGQGLLSFDSQSSDR